MSLLRLRLSIAAIAALVVCARREALAQRGQAAARHRAILVSFDGFSEQRLREYSDSASAPHLWAMFAQSTCSESVRPAFPSVTPVGHASIWTGAYSNVNGVAAQSNAALPIQSNTILDWTDGYKPAALRAEPIWLAAARQGKTVFSHMATQSPQPPAYTPIDHSTPALDSARARDARVDAQPNIAALNIYNELVEGARVITRRTGLDWAFGKEGDSLHARVRDDSTVVVHLNGDEAHGVAVHLAATDTTSPRGRPLARYFSAPLRIPLRGGRETFVFLRLFELSNTNMLMYVSEGRVLQANHPEIVAAYDAAVQGLPGNAGHLDDRGDFGTPVARGGDGTAEARYMETAELVVRQFMKGTEWGWRTYHPDLETDYTPYPDEALHDFLGYADPGTPNVSPRTRAVAAKMLKRVYELVDVRLDQFERLAASTPGTRLFVTGEHGMRPAWLSFHGNVALRDAGLVVLDSAGAIDLHRTKAAMTAGSWVVVNRTARKGGIVPPDSVEAVIARVEQTLRAVRDSAGHPVVTRIFRAGTIEGDSLGLGAPGGGDVYFELAPRYYYSASLTGAATGPLDRPRGEHGFPSIDRDMQPIFCMVGPGAVAKRLGVTRSIDIAPTVSAWLNIAPPADARGRSLIK